jgi:uncharacterized protein YcbK (DUF882 family)
MDPDFMDDLQALRSLSAFPFKITSAYRCPDHNAAVSSTGRDGPHTTGRAVDISIRGAQAFKLVCHATAAGFTGLGVNQKGGGRFIHIDKSETHPRPAVWSY